LCFPKTKKGAKGSPPWGSETTFKGEKQCKGNVGVRKSIKVPPAKNGAQCYNADKESPNYPKGHERGDPSRKYSHFSFEESAAVAARRKAAGKQQLLQTLIAIIRYSSTVRLGGREKGVKGGGEDRKEVSIRGGGYAI